jgi:hypothetical protein
MTERAGKKVREVLVPGAEDQECSYLDDLTTVGTLSTATQI